MNKILTTLLILIFFFGCSRNKNLSIINGIPINLKQNDKVSTNEIFKKIDLIPLETSDNVSIKRADKIIYYGNKYYVLDVAKYQLCIFDERGKFLLKIQKPTHGFGQFEKIRDFEIDKYNNRLELLSPNGTVFLYDLEGKYIRPFFVPDIRTAQFLKNVTRDIVAFYSMFEPNRLTFYSLGLNKNVKSTYTIPEFITRSTSLNSSSSPFQSYEGESHFSTVFSNSVYILSKDNSKVKYTWDFGQYNFNFDTLKANQSRAYYGSVLSRTSEKVFYFFDNVETKNKLFTTFLFKGKVVNLIYDKPTSTYKLFENFSEGINYSKHITAFDGGVYTIVDPNIIPKTVTSQLLDEQNQKILNAIRLTDNPVIVKYYFK